MGSAQQLTGGPVATTAVSKLAAVVRLVARSILASLGCLVVLSVLPVAAGWHSYLVMSGSMSPQILTGDLVIAAPVSRSVIAPGHVLVFTDPSTPDRLLVHRVVSSDGDGPITTKGDANGTADSSPVSAEAVKGLGRLRIPFIGLPAYWTATGSWGYFGTATVALLGLLALGYRSPRESGAVQPVNVSLQASQLWPTLRWWIAHRSRRATQWVSTRTKRGSRSPSAAAPSMVDHVEGANASSTAAVLGHVGNTSGSPGGHSASTAMQVKVSPRATGVDCRWPPIPLGAGTPLPTALRRARAITRRAPHTTSGTSGAPTANGPTSGYPFAWTSPHDNAVAGAIVRPVKKRRHRTTKSGARRR